MRAMRLRQPHGVTFRGGRVDDRHRAVRDANRADVHRAGRPLAVGLLRLLLHEPGHVPAVGVAASRRIVGSLIRIASMTMPPETKSKAL